MVFLGLQESKVGEEGMVKEGREDEGLEVVLIDL